MANDVFLSYSRQDNAIMERVVAALNDAGLTIWTDKGISPGSPSWKVAIEEAIRESRCVVVLFSPDAAISRWVRSELDFSEAQGVRIYPLLVSGDEKNAVPFGFNAHQWIDFRDPGGFNSNIARLVDSIRSDATLHSDRTQSSSTTKIRQSKAWIILLKYAIGLAILVFIVATNWDVTQNGEQVGFSALLTRSIDPGFFALGLGLAAVGVSITFVRWYFLVIAQDLPITPRDVARLGFIGLFFNTFLPASVGGDLVKVAYIVREQSRRTVAVATVVMDRVIGLAGLFWLATLVGGTLYFAGVFDPLLTLPTAHTAIETILLITSGVVAATIVVWVVIGLIPSAWLDRFEVRLEEVFRKIGHSLAELVRAVRVYRRKGRTVALALGMSMVSHFCFVLAFYCGARVFQPEDEMPPLLAHLLIVPVGMTIRASIPLPAGLGGSEYSFGKLYQWFGAPFIGGVFGSLVGQTGFQLILGLIGLIAYRNFEKPAPLAQSEGRLAAPSPPGTPGGRGLG